MKVAYVDTSSLIAIAFKEPTGAAMAEELRGYDHLVSSNLLEAEFRATLVREGIPDRGAVLLEQLSWIFPDRPLTREMNRVTEEGYLRGADLWHVACALFLAGQPRNLTFATLDRRQREVARQLGFGVTLRPRSDE